MSNIGDVNDPTPEEAVNISENEWETFASSLEGVLSREQIAKKLVTSLKTVIDQFLISHGANEEQAESAKNVFVKLAAFPIDNLDPKDIMATVDEITGQLSENTKIIERSNDLAAALYASLSNNYTSISPRTLAELKDVCSYVSNLANIVLEVYGKGADDSDYAPPLEGV